MTDADLQILRCLEEGRSFLLDAGAGSGKTSSLVRALNYIRSARRAALIQASQKVACITFTNVAKDEIAERTEHDPLFAISTIHDFLWSVVKSYQKELRVTLAQFNDGLPANSRRKQDGEALDSALKAVGQVTYSDRGSNFLEGRIFHDDLLGVAELMFEHYPLLSRVVAARYPIILVDEYQDTDAKVISILLGRVIRARPAPVIGFFGDKLQSIYPDGVGEIGENLRSELIPIKKEENYRCSRAVIAVLNRLRTDIQQLPAGDNVEGSAIYLGLDGLGDEEDPAARALEIAKERFGWGTEDDAAKTLFLTHRLIARKAGYSTLWGCYNELGSFSRERFQSGDDETAAFFVRKVEPLIDAWIEKNQGRVISIVSRTGAICAAAEEKSMLKAAMDELIRLTESGATVREVTAHIERAKLLAVPDTLAGWARAGAGSGDADAAEGDREAQFYRALSAVPYREISAYRKVLENDLPYSTKHGVKGAEFETVVVILDDAGARWNQYSFGNFLGGGDHIEARFIRTRNLFYVSCSRAKRNLAVVNLGSSKGREEAIRGIFGAENCAL